MDETRVRETLLELFGAGVLAAMPGPGVARALAGIDPPTLVLAVGKAAVEMASAAAQALPPPRRALVISRAEQLRPLAGQLMLAGGHPRPDPRSLAAGRAALDMARSAGPSDHLLVLLSGGASALMALPAPGLALEAKADLADALMARGADIGELNLVRRHLSRIKGGRLAAAAHPARVTTLALSDVVGDLPHDIGSGPTVGDPTSRGDALEALARRGLAIDPAVVVESVRPGDPRLAGASFATIGGAGAAVLAASAAARARGYTPEVLGTELTGEARELGALHGRLARARARAGRRTALISGGEMTAAVRGGGLGGPNLDYVAALALEIAGVPGVGCFSGDTDGLDGTSGACGAFAFPETAARARAIGRPLEAALARSDTAAAFEALGALYRPGPTGTNVNDLRLVLIEGAAGQER